MLIKNLGTHAAFEETMADIEIKREQTIEYAEHYKAYELLFAHRQYDMEMRMIEEEYNVRLSILYQRGLIIFFLFFFVYKE